MRPKILICDDEDVLRRLVRATLARGDYDLIEARDGDEAVEVAEAEQPQLILLDMMMPRRTGIHVLEHVRANPALAATPVIMLSARTQETDRAAADDAGATFFLPKPFSPSELAALVARTLATGESVEVHDRFGSVSKP
jgi:DNA-binding response OmpR family regulator